MVNTNCNDPWNVGFRTNRGMSQLFLRMLKDAQKEIEFSLSFVLLSFHSHTFSFPSFLLPPLPSFFFSSFPCPFPSLFLSFPFFLYFLQSLVYGRVSDSHLFSSQCMLWRHKTRMCINTYSAIMLIPLDQTGENPQQQILPQSRIVCNLCTLAHRFPVLLE